MKKKLLAILAIASAATTYAAAPMRLASITDVDPDYPEDTETFIYDAEGRLEKISDNESTITIDYSRLAANKLVLTYTSSYYPGEDTSFDIDINELGLAVKAVETDRDGVDNEWEFIYSDDKLIRIVQKSGRDVENTDITWGDGIILSYLESNPDDIYDTTEVTFGYSGVSNTGKLALFDELYGMDLDELEYLAMAGFMGQRPLELPSSMTTKDDDGSITQNVTWETDAEGYPTKVYDSHYSREYTLFTWEADPSSVSTVGIDSNGVSEFFTIDGRRAAENATGLVIERKADGSTVKRIIK